MAHSGPPQTLHHLLSLFSGQHICNIDTVFPHSGPWGSSALPQAPSLLLTPALLGLEPFLALPTLHFEQYPISIVLDQKAHLFQGGFLIGAHTDNRTPSLPVSTGFRGSGQTCSLHPDVSTWCRRTLISCPGAPPKQRGGREVQAGGPGVPGPGMTTLSCPSIRVSRPSAKAVL